MVINGPTIQKSQKSKGGLWIVYNGEIYNFKEIRKDLEKKGYKFNSDTDTEVILNAYDYYGEKCLNLFNGQFSFVIYNSVKKNFFGARDRIGIKPLYYYHKNNKFIFCSELKSILLHELPRDIDLDFLNRFVSFRYSGGPDSIIKNIKRLQPGHYFNYNLGTNNLSINRFWGPKYSIENKSEDYYIKEFLKEFKESVKRRLVSDVPLGSYLSGGIDSSAVIAMMKNYQDNIKTFSIGFGYGGVVDENHFAKEVAEKFETNHKEFILEADLVRDLPRIVWHGDEPNADPAALPFFLLSEKAKKYATVILTGEGADEVFAGYEQNKFMLKRNKLMYIPKPIRKFGAKTVNVVPDKILNRFFPYTTNIGKEGKNRFCNYVTNIDNKAESYCEIMGIFTKKEREKLLTNTTIGKLKTFDNVPRLNKTYFSDNNDFLNQILRLDISEPLPDNLLMKTDRSCMASAVEVRIPFLDYKLVELAGRMPTSLKLKNWNNDKYIVRKAMKPYLPQDVLKRKKHRFYVPIDYWYKDKEVKALVDSLLDKKAIDKQGYFNYNEIRKITNNFASSPLFYARQLWTLLNFQIWHKMFIEEERMDKKLKVPSII